MSPNATSSTNSSYATITHTATASPTSNSSTTAVGIGLGVGLGVLAIAGSLGGFFAGMSRGKKMAAKTQMYGMDRQGNSLDTKQPMLPYDDQGHGHGGVYEQFGNGQQIHEVQAPLHGGPAELGNSPVQS
jgi:hypothetical protein